MRAGVWCGVAVTLLLVATDAIRTVQGEGISRTSRRTITDRSANNLNKTEENIPTYRSRSIKRREETQELSTVRSRNRGRTLEKDNISPKVEIQAQSGQNEPFESRRSSIRSRSRTIAKEATTENILSRESIIRGRSRGNGRKYTPTTTPFNDQPESSSNQVAATLPPRSVEIRSEIIKTNEILPTGATAPSNQFRRRSSTVSTVEATKQIRPRGRINTRTNSRALDLEVAGTTNTFTAAAKQTTIARISDGRNSRKLRYKSRTLETDTNITGVGITPLNEVEKSSQRNDITSEPEYSETNSTTSKATENTFQTSTESVLRSSTLKSSKVVRRPITRSNGYFKSSEVKSNSKMSDEINEDDNYPESFKAIIQAKNATQTNSSIGESLSVKASHKDSNTHALSFQTNTTDPGTDKNSRLRKKLRIEEKNKKADEQEALSLGSTSTTTTSEAPKPRSIPFRPRGTYLSRSKKPNVTKSTTENISYASRPSLENPYKFSKRIKSSTEPSMTDITLKTKRLDSLPKKQVIRSSLFSRKNDPVNKNITVIPLNENRKHDRVQSGSNFKARRTLPNTTYYSRLRNNTKLYMTETSYVEKNTETPIADKKVGNSADMPLIFTYLNGPGLSDKLQPSIENTAPVLNSKESQENSTENEIVNKAEESENKLIINTDVTTPKYHANYKENMQSEKAITSATPAIRNIKTRKYARKQEKGKDQETNTPSVIFKSKDRNVRKYGDTFSKTTESPANSISQEPVKPKHKFSSKYRGSYLDRPFYKPTVPTVTPSATVEGEEIQLGPDMNAIAFTKTRRPLSSADLRLSESLAKPLQVLNVEVSQHSPSVTVSIFDALAEILTSTPKPRISTTAETLPKNINEINIMHSLDGVSSNVNVNTVTGFATQESVTSKDNLNTNAKFVKTTEPVVFNSLLVGDNVTPSLKAEDEKTSYFTSPKTVPIPIPTTPISARKPFAIKVLYTETESTSKNSPTAMPTSRLTSTDKSTMVYNSISDLLLSNNGVVSTGLTSMLSNNIRSIIDSMDDESKSKLSVGMTNLLNTLIPGAINNISKVEEDSTAYMTTPYSLEDINDTANIEININESSNIHNKILQNVSDGESIVNTETLLNSQTEIDVEGTTPVNSFDLLENVQNLESESDNTLRFESNVLTNTLKDTTSTTARVTVDNIENLDETPTNEELVTLSILNPLRDITTETSNIQLESPSLAKLLSFNQLDDSEVLEDPSQVSQLQLWVLSKKARVLKMIEDLLRIHSDEISNPPLGIRNKPKISFSNRLTEIMNTMNFTTTGPDFTERTTLDSIESSFSSTTTVPYTSTLSLLNNLNGDFDLTTQNINGIIFTNDESSTKTVSEIADAFTTANSVPTTTVSEDIVTTSDSKEIENEKLELASTTTSNFETTTGIAEARIVVDTTVMTNVEDTSTSGIETTTAKVMNESKSADFITTSNMLNVATRPSIPKKDFVIFGILPNNTVTKQIRTEKPNDGTGNTVFKFIPIEDVTVPSTQETNVLKLATPKTTRVATVTTEVNTPNPQIQMNIESNTVATSTTEPFIATPVTNSEKVIDEPPTPIFMNEFELTTEAQNFTLTDLNNDRTTFTPDQTTAATTTSLPELQINNDDVEFTTTAQTTYRIPVATSVPIGSATNTVFQTQPSPPTLPNDRNPKKISEFNTAQNQEENAKLLQALLMATSQGKNSNNNLITKTRPLTTTVRSIEDDIRQFEEDTKLLKALLQATGRDPATLNLPSLDGIKAVITTLKPSIATTTLQTTSTLPPSTVPITQFTTTETTTSSIINEDVKRLQEDTKLLQALLQVTGNKNGGDMPVISGLTSNVRIASNPLTTSMESKSTTSFNVRPVYTTTQFTPTTTVRSQIITVSTLQPTTEDIGISTTFRPVNVRTQSTTVNRPTVTTEIPSSSTYSDEEDLLFLKNLKSVLSTKSKNEDPETSLANRVIALAVERSLNEIQVGKNVGTTKVMTTTTTTSRPTTTATQATTTPRPTTKPTTTRVTTTPRQNIPSIEDDIKQFEQDTKLLQALLKATGQDPSKFNIPTLPTTTVSAQFPNIPQGINDDLNLLSNLLASPSPLNEPFDPLTQKPAPTQATQRTPTSTVPYGIQIAVKDDLKNEQDDAKLLQTLIKLQDAQETTTVRSKLAITGHSSDEALKKLIQKTQPAGMMSESTKPSMSLSTEYGNSNDALLAALLKEQGFGPTTASSLDEQIRLAALLNQVVVTPKARRTTTPPPPPPAPRRPILDGLSWLWQQWRDTAPGSQGPRQSRPAPTRNQPAQSASATSSRVNWFGSGPFVGNADERPANRIPLEPPSAVEQPPGRGQLVSAAINVTRAFSQFLGAAIQGAAQTVQNVFRAGQNTYTNGSGGSG
ncbi:mucin-3A isoform X13 [Pieris rapae]|uniref:mucin-3A isoform X13 n=1 Tax=Pieris rapae TaxID=64459 RepID=UPI001E27BBF2|nr:mucin-3A isoform X13 [Pieris rapae]